VAAIKHTTRRPSAMHVATTCVDLAKMVCSQRTNSA
jgi:hypothetical protein